MSINNEQPPISSESATPIEKRNKRPQKTGLLYGLLALGVVVIAVGVVLVFLLK
jgi:hypothetical protein